MDVALVRDNDWMFEIGKRQWYWTLDTDVRSMAYIQEGLNSGWLKLWGLIFRRANALVAECQVADHLGAYLPQGSHSVHRVF